MFRECIQEVSHSIVKVEEGKRKAHFLNPSSKKYQKIRIDNCVVKNGLRADFLLNEEDERSVLIELKGSGIEHACKQLFTSVGHPDVKMLLTKRVGFLVVCSKYPRFDTFVRKAKDTAAKRYKSGLHVCCDQGTFNIERLVKIAS